MKCPSCGSEKVIKKGTRGGNQRYSCSYCNAHFTENKEYKSSPKLEPLNLNCPHCGSNRVVRDGKLENGKQRYTCRNCRKGFSDKESLKYSLSKSKLESFAKRKEALKQIFNGKSISQVSEKTGFSPRYLRSLAQPLYEKESLSTEQKRLIVTYGYYFKVPIEYIAEYIPCSLRTCKKVLDNFNEKLEKNPKLKKKAMSTILGATLKNLSKICHSFSVQKS